MPYVYETIGGLSNLQANILKAVLWTIIVLSFYFIFAKFGDKVDRKKLYGLGALIGIAAWVILTFVGMSWIGLASFVLLWGIHEGIGWQGFYALWQKNCLHLSIGELLKDLCFSLFEDLREYGPSFFQLC